MYVPGLLTILLYVTTLSALFVNVHWWNQTDNEACMAEKRARMSVSNTLTSLTIALFVLIPVGYYGTVFGLEYLRGSKPSSGVTRW